MHNTTREGRELNRRIGFKVLLDTEGKIMSFALLKRYSLCLALVGGAFLTSLAAAEAESPADVIAAKLVKARPDFSVTSVKPSPAPGIFEVQLAGGPLVYATADGEYFFLGDLFDVQPSGVVNLAELARDEARKELMAGVDREDMVVFSPEGETKAWVAVFTDVDCFYCQKLHQEVPELNRRGIEVRYLAYPRAGVGSESYRKIVSAWCAADPQSAITKLKNRQPIDDNVCADNPVAGQFMLGQQMGVRGTPALVLQNGTMIPGYVEAADLVTRMGIN
jgi:thiol:disulfide interchange protein DsbC